METTGGCIKLINDNIFPPGTFLPPERELAKQLGVSRASLREALIVLEISGWIVIQSGNGVIVSDKKHLASDYTIEEILSTRELVDSHCARLAAQNDNVDVINQIEAIYHRMDMRQSDADSAYEGSLEHLRYVRKIVGG